MIGANKSGQIFTAAAAESAIAAMNGFLRMAITVPIRAGASNISIWAALKALKMRSGLSA